MLEDDILKLNEPFSLFDRWLSEAKSHSGIREATAMSLATVSAQGTPDVRTVLCKEAGPNGFVFFTNYNSHKGQDIASHPQVACGFYWDPLFRQIKILGTVEKTSRQESEAYWQTRARESQISQTISRQSEQATSREQLEQLWTEAENKMSGKNIPCPAHWGGYRVTPQSLEFWLGQKGRLHDRFRFEKVQTSWTIARLFP